MPADDVTRTMESIEKSLAALRAQSASGSTRAGDVFALVEYQLVEHRKVLDELLIRLREVETKFSNLTGKLAAAWIAGTFIAGAVSAIVVKLLTDGG